MISEYLNEKTILLQQEATDKEDAIQKACQPLCDNGWITQDYVNDAITALKELGSYMVIVPGVALIHARPSDAVKKDCLSLMTLKTPVVFGHPQNDPVKTLFAFASNEADKHLDVIGELPILLGDEEFMSYLSKCNDVNKLMFYIKNNI